MKLFSVEEARALLPTLRRLMQIIRDEREVLRVLSAEIKQAGARARENGGSPAGQRYLTALHRISQYAEQITNLGIQIKDFDKGLCDFPHQREGNVVLLCWQWGEDDIEWWHEIEAGFAGRQRL
jgi:hypothetical protein